VSRAAARAARLAAVAALAASALAAQVARPQKARLDLEPAAIEVAAGAEALVEAIVAIDDGWHLQAHVPTYDYLIPTVLTVELPGGYGAARVDYPAPTRYKFSFADEELDVYEGIVRLPVRFGVPDGAAAGPLPMRATLRYQACDDKSCLPPVDTSAAIELEVVASALAAASTAPTPVVPATAAATPAAEAVPPAEPAGATPAVAVAAASSPPATATSPVAAGERSSTAGPSFAGILLLALIGGLILNGMPCVLPILSLKLFGLVKAAGQSRASVRAGAVATAAGIVLSFWALAVAALAARGAGAAIGWGVQFQQPGFVAFLAVVILLFSLNLWGLFEIPLPARLARLADAGGGEGLGGHFASGLFATLMATPCSAPFLGTALSFALGQTAGVIFATLTAVGVGLALPYLLLAAWPGFVRHLPKPGAWMDTLRGTMGFLLAAALVWLLYVLQAQVAAESVAFFELALLALGLAVWLAGRARLGGAGRRIGWLTALALGVVAVLLVADAPAGAKRVDESAASNVIAWRPWDRAEAEQLAASGRLVFLDITADWCVTCKVNERVVLHTPAVAGAFRRLDVVPMKADWTNRDDTIAAFLAEHGRYGIPFYLLYRPGQPPHVFGELITQQGVVEVLEASAAAVAAPAG
jgi:suppressor for copper-sensitivity B